MNRKQIRDYYRSFKGDMSIEGRQKSAIRRQVFSSFGPAVANHLNKKAFSK